MNNPLELWRWWITDERSGKRRLTKWYMTEADALERYPDAERDLRSHEVRAGTGNVGNTVPPKQA